MPDDFVHSIVRKYGAFVSFVPATSLQTGFLTYWLDRPERHYNTLLPRELDSKYICLQYLASLV